MNLLLGRKNNNNQSFCGSHVFHFLEQKNIGSNSGGDVLCSTKWLKSNSTARRLALHKRYWCCIQNIIFIPQWSSDFPNVADKLAENANWEVEHSCYQLNFATHMEPGLMQSEEGDFRTQLLTKLSVLIGEENSESRQIKTLIVCRLKYMGCCGISWLCNDKGRCLGSDTVIADISCFLNTLSSISLCTVPDVSLQCCVDIILSTSVYFHRFSCFIDNTFHYRLPQGVSDLGPKWSD